MTGFNWTRAWLPTWARRSPRLATAALAVALTLGLALARGAAGSPQSVARAAGAVGAKLQRQAAATTTHSPRVARADAHIESQVNGADLEINLAITQTENDCQAPLNGGVCLHYAVISDEQAVMVGYGVIPGSDMKMSGGKITLRVDVSKTPGFARVTGSAPLIIMTWQAASGKSGMVQRCSVQGSIGSYTFSNVTAIGPSSSGSISVGAARASAVSTNIIATMYIR
jgi:hypothetical protein